MLGTAWSRAYHETTRDVCYAPYCSAWNLTWNTGIARIHDTMKSPDVNGTMGPERHAL